MWKQGLGGSGGALQETLKYIADFKKVYDLHVEPGGWYPADEKKTSK